MQSRDAFEIGFMLRCADEGLSGRESRCRAEAAFGLLNGIVKAGKHEDSSGDVFSLQDMQLPGLLQAAFLPAHLAGNIVGSLAASATPAQHDDAEAVKKEQLIAALKRYSRRKYFGTEKH